MRVFLFNKNTINFKNNVTVDEVKEAIAARNVALADTKARSEKANAASGAGTVTNAAAPSANSQFKF